MQEEFRKRLLDHIEKSSGYDIALMTTFNFEIGFFERAIVNRLYEKNVKKISVFIDSKELTKSITEVNACQMGLKYVINPIRLNASFHPKVILLLGKKKAKLIVGSANLKSSGMEINNEVFNYIEYSEKQPEYQDVIVSAIRFFSKINELSYGLDNEIVEEAKRMPYYSRAKENGETVLISNIEKSILDQITNLIKDTVKNIQIAVPYYDNRLEALSEIKQRFPDANIELFLQNNKSSFPLEYNKNNNVVDTIKAYEGFLDGQDNNRNNFYHGKVYLFKTDKNAYALYGSANCTNAALTKSFADKGNIECDLFDIGELEEFDYFFNNIEIINTNEIHTNTIKYEPEERKNYFFKYGVRNERLELHIGYENIKSLVVSYYNHQAEYSIKDDEIIVYLPDDIVDSNIFDIILKYDDVIEKLRCWILNYDILNRNRQKNSDKSILDSFDFSIDSSKYKEDRYNLLMAETLFYQEYKESKALLSNLNQLKLEQEDDDTELDLSKDYVVDVQIPEEYSAGYRKFEKVKKIRTHYISRALNGYVEFFNYSKHITPLKKDKDKVKKEGTKQREPASDEKRFARFVIRRVKGIFEKPLLEIIDPTHYYGIVLVILEIFSKYIDIDLFDFDYVFKTRINMYINTVDMTFTEEERDLEKEVLENAFFVLVDNYVISLHTKDLAKRQELDDDNRKLLLSIDRHYKIRSSYKKLLLELQSQYGESFPEYDNEFTSYIEKLFGYKNLELLTEYITTIYNGAQVEQKEEIFNISVEVEDIANHFQPKMNVIKEILNYSNNVSKINNVYLSIKSKIESTNVKKIDYMIDYKFCKISSKTYYRNGSVLDEKPEYLNLL